MARNLLRSGKFESVVVWNRTLSKASGGTNTSAPAAPPAASCR